jgi:hypothetical protein
MTVFVGARGEREVTVRLGRMWLAGDLNDATIQLEQH